MKRPWETKPRLCCIKYLRKIHNILRKNVSINCAITLLTSFRRET